MSIFNDKALKGVAEAAAKIMAETSHGSHPKTPKEKSLAALAHPKDKITHKDVLVGRGVLKKEETEQLQEYESKAGVFKHKAKLEKGAKYGETDYNKDDDDDKKEKSPKRAQKGYGAHQNKRSQKVDYDDSDKDTGERMKPGRIKKTKTGLIHKMNESLSFTEMLELYNEHGLKVLAPIETEEMDIDGTTVEVIDADKVNGVVDTIVEEPTEEEFNKELKDQQDSFAGKKKQPKVAAGKTTGVKVMPEEVELDEYEYITESEYEMLDDDEKTLWEAITASTYEKLRQKKMNTPASEFGEKGKKSKIEKQIRHHEFRHRHETGKNLYATDFKVGKKDTAEMLYRKKAGKKGQIPSQRADVRRPRYEEYQDEGNVNQLDERTLTKGEAKKKEDYVMGMKKKLSGFKQRYGERAKSVMYATATKMAKKD